MYVLIWIDLALNAFSVPKVAFSGLLPWWRHQMETFSALLPICTGNSPVPGEFPTQKPVTRSFDVFFDLRSNKRLSKQWRGWWFETESYPLWRHRNVHGRIRCSTSHHSMYPQNSMTPLSLLISFPIALEFSRKYVYAKSLITTFCYHRVWNINNAFQVFSMFESQECQLRWVVSFLCWYVIVPKQYKRLKIILQYVWQHSVVDVTYIHHFFSCTTALQGGIER